MPYRPALPVLCLAIVSALSLPFPVASAATTPIAAMPSAVEAQSLALTRASAAVVGLRAVALEDARSLATLGRERQGSGVVIGADGLVLTIGYLILEAELVLLVTDDERQVPARVLAYDTATGFGLVQALVPLNLAPVPLGNAAAVGTSEPLMMASGGGEGTVGMARLLSRRAFSGFWEYHVEDALFTVPPRQDHSGAGLFNQRGELVGIGSLLVGDANAPDSPRQPGNMFISIDLLKPILAELRERGSTSASRRAWLGLNCVEYEGQVRVMRVSDDSPAEVAGLEPGDFIVRIDGTSVWRLEQFYKALWRGASPEREIVLDIRRDGKPQTLKVQAVDRAKTLRHAVGI